MPGPRGWIQDSVAEAPQDGELLLHLFVRAPIEVVLDKTRILDAIPKIHAEITRKRLGTRRHRTCPRAVKRARHNSYRVKKPDERASILHNGPATILIHSLTPRAA